MNHWNITPLVNYLYFSTPESRECPSAQLDDNCTVAPKSKKYNCAKFRDTQRLRCVIAQTVKRLSDIFDMVLPRTAHAPYPRPQVSVTTTPVSGFLQRGESHFSSHVTGHPLPAFLVRSVAFLYTRSYGGLSPDRRQPTVQHRVIRFHGKV